MFKDLFKGFSIFLFLIVILVSCGKDGGLFSSSELSGDKATSGLTGDVDNGSGKVTGGGKITAAEWNDLQNWTFWDTTISKSEFNMLPSQWGLFNTNRISVQIKNTNLSPASNAIVVLKKNGVPVFATKTDNFGKAELWPNLFFNQPIADFSPYSIDINNGEKIINNMKSYKDGINEAIIGTNVLPMAIEIAFVVDATGSMGDELEFLKDELYSVLNRISDTLRNATVSTGSVFYRDFGDDYITKFSAFSNNMSQTINFIKAQSAGGGGDWPEAVHSALETTLKSLQWSNNATTKIVFLILDAPPHQDDQTVKSSLQNSVLNMAKAGIKIIPIAASGIDDNTEFFLRFLSITTNGSYIFITNDSGIGNSHKKAIVGNYKVDFLNNLLVKLVYRYASQP
ncbi:MAG: vWA domain-containing protein [Alphaproteobacteria bacterium]|nr:vWA domain-containing protein [Alphaproteobacteria bacterium]